MLTNPAVGPIRTILKAQTRIPTDELGAGGKSAGEEREGVDENDDYAAKLN
jgi:hypothetical protein